MSVLLLCACTGRQTAHDIAAFGRDSAQTGVRALGPSDFPRIVSDKRPAFIDFFAPVS